MIASDHHDILRRILAVKGEEVAGLALRRDEWRRLAGDMPPPRDFRGALSGAGLAVIAEIKRSSPSAGAIDAKFAAAVLAQSYVAAGAAALSVLTDREFFGARADDLERVRAAVSVPLLRKDFIIDPVQVYESRARGADSLLLIAAAVSDPCLGDLLGLARALGMEPLVEVHDEVELDRAVGVGAAIIGVNCRDLRTFEVSLAVAERLRPCFPAGVLAVAESGIRVPADAVRLGRVGFHAVLIGEALVRHGASGCAGFFKQLQER